MLLKMVMPTIKRLYSDDDSLEEKITKIVTEIYGGKSVVFEKKAKNQLKQFAEFGWDKLPVCMAKTQYSFSDNQFLLGAPEGLISLSVNLFLKQVLDLS